MNPNSASGGPPPIRRLSAVLASCLLALAVGAGTAAGQTVPATVIQELSLEEAVRLAHEYNPDYRIQEAQGETAEWRTREAWGNLLPSANVSSGVGYTASGERRFESVQLATQPAVYSSRYNFGVSLSLTGASLLRPGVVREENLATEARIEGASAGLRSEVVAGYLRALQADEELRQALAEVDRTGSYVRQAEAQVDVGAGTPLDIRRAESQLGQAEVRLLQAEHQVAITRLQLGRLIGVPLAEDAALPTAFEIFEPALDGAELLRTALDRNPVLRASRRQAEAARSQARIARTQYLPSLSVSAGVSGSVFQSADIQPLVHDRMRQLSNQFDSCAEDNRIRDLLGDPPRDCSIFDPDDPSVQAGAEAQIRAQNRGFPFGFNSQPLSLSMTLSFPIFTGFSRQLQVEEARVARGTAAQQVRAEELRLRSEVEGAIRNVDTALRTVALQERNRESAAEELRLAQERFRLGLASSIEVIDAQANLSEAERAEISAMYDFHISFGQLEALVGEPLRDR